MTTVVYDGSFEGLLTAIFEIYEYKFDDADIRNENSAMENIFNASHIVHTNDNKAFRVMQMLQKKLSREGVKNFFAMFLSEELGIENKLYNYVKLIVESPVSVEKNFNNATILKLSNAVRKVYKERHRMEAFVRFKQTLDDLYYALIEPDFNVLPLLISHFKSRYADQNWLIYDMKRRYGIYYNKIEVNYINIDFNQLKHNLLTEQNNLHKNEMLFEELWKQYFTSINIKARKNAKLHTQHMPKRYWKYLTEKQ